jgi:PAS domain S-box-containing protein
MKKTLLPSSLRLGLAPMSVALATAIQLALDPLLGGRFPFLTFFVAIAVTTWYGGLEPSLLAVVLSWFAFDHFFLEPRGPGPFLLDKSQIIWLFFAVGLTITLLSEAARDARSRARISASQARRAIEAQQAQAEWLRVTLASIGDAVITTDSAGRVTSLNPAAERLTGSGGQEAVGRPWTEVFRTIEGAIDGTAYFPVAGVVRGEAVLSGHHTILIDDGGATKSVELNAAPIRYDWGEIAGVVIVMRDITERRKTEQALRESEARLRHLADAMPQIVWTATPDGSVDYFNARWYEYTGLTPQGPLPEVWRAADHLDDLGRFSSVRDRGIDEGQVYEAEVRLRRKDGSYRWHLIRSVPVPDRAGGLARRFGAATDINDRRRAEEALVEADRRKDEFLATLAHELRNPLAPIRNALRLMKHRDGDGPMETERAMAERQVVHLARLIDDLMDVARISRGKIDLHREVVDLATVVNQAVETARPQIDERRHRLSVSVPDQAVRLEGDPTRLEQIFWNLLNNAAKYTDPGGEIRLTVEPGGGEVAIRVRDTGIGIPRESLPHIFEMFVQADRRRDRSQGGLGIGLNLVKTLVEMHGGNVEARSRGPGTGSEFVVRLPVTPETILVRAGPDRCKRSQTEAEPPRRRLLVVDDNVDGATSLAQLLRQVYRQEVRVAHDGPGALGLAGEFRPEMVLLDIEMPGMDGYEVAQRMRGRGDLDGVRIIAMTAWGQEEDRLMSREAGFDHHLVKPLDFEVLCRLLVSPAAV